MKVVYVAGPYRSKIPFKRLYNIWLARRYARKLWDSGIVALCPHSNSAFFDNVGDEMILGGCIELMLRCDAMLVLPNSTKSHGTREEIKRAMLNSIPIYSGANIENMIRDFDEGVTKGDLRSVVKHMGGAL